MISSPSSWLGCGAGILIAAVAQAQQVGTIRGVVIDKDFDDPLPGVSVKASGVERRVVTDENGVFVMRGLRPGSYTVVLAKDGYTRSVQQIRVVAGRQTNQRIEMLGDFTDLEEYVVREQVEQALNTEQRVLNKRFDNAAMMDAISSELMRSSGAGDAGDALRVVAGAGTKDGKSAVIRGLPDRYVATQVNGVLFPSSDEDKRAVELDVFPTSALETVEVSKTFTPDQQGNASGGAVNVVLRSVPDKPFFVNYSVGTSYNSQTTGRGDFLSYAGGGVSAFGRGGGERNIQAEGTSWEGAVGASPVEAPDNIKWSGSMGGRFDVNDDWRVGGFVNFFYDRSSRFRQNARDESWQVGQVGSLMTPQTQLGTITSPPYTTSLLRLDQASETVQFGGLSTIGIASDDHSINLTHLFSRVAEDTVTFAEDTQGKNYFFPGFDPADPSSPGYNQNDSAPWTRQQTLAYVERGTEALQLAGRHRWDVYGYGSLRGVELDWTLARNQAFRDTPDRREFATYWDPGAGPNGSFFQLKPAAEFTLGNLQRTFIKIDEESDQIALNLKLPIEVWGGLEGSLKFGVFRDTVVRTFNQETFSNFNDPNASYQGSWTGAGWAQNWLFEEHLITAAETDVDYIGSQSIDAQYAMFDLPLNEEVRMVGGLRWESTDISIQSFAEENATWVPSFDASGNPNYGIANFPTSDPSDPSFDPALLASANPERSQDDVLPALGLIYEPVEGLITRASYTKTLARQTFKELSPVFQQDYIGGPVFIGDPNLEISDVTNFDLRVDYIPAPGSLFSVSYFRKDIKKPIEYVESAQGFTFTKPVNYPSGKLIGWEVEARQEIGELWRPLSGLQLGGNSTWIDATVRRPDSELEQFLQFQGVEDDPTRRMTDAPDYLWNLFTTYDLESTGTSFGAFYTVTGDALIQGPGPTNNAFIPATIDRSYDSLSLTIRQVLGRGVTLSLKANNLTDARRQQFYSTKYLAEDKLRRDYTTGVTYSLSIGGEIRF
ncbi:MAG: TonB-dependent receptor [Planctomycetota bacterium]|nr:TonB-dependent receptor [Planctomycetota bacterium]